ncbi:hypothetical protein DB30_00695 [Enhygromyxa salina]|uniref:Uncharacterized protein n=1 Tax=Enhygromyxa salina TaxID=215803 RepID=A0A0C2DA33_9BACT|nr:hypothetical protein DB30_00695 [Enhygromyxa salina]
MQELLGVAVVSFTNPAAPRVERVRVLEDTCSLFAACGEVAGTMNTSAPMWSEMARIVLEHAEVSDVDGDGQLEIEIVTSYVELTTFAQEQADEPYADEIFSRRRLTVLRGDLSRQLDTDIHVEMFESTPGVLLEADRIHERYTLTPDGLTAYWCEVDGQFAIPARECSKQVCPEPTTRARMSYDAAKDAYGKAEIEQLRPVVDSCPE